MRMQVIVMRGREHWEPVIPIGQAQKLDHERAGSPRDARPERHQGRVAQLTHNAALASRGRRAPHRTFCSSFSSRDEWVGRRARA